MCPATWLKTLVFGQSRYRKFSGVSGCEAIIDKLCETLRTFVRFDPNPQLLHALLPIGLRDDGSLQVHLKVDYAIRGRD